MRFKKISIMSYSVIVGGVLGLLLLSYISINYVSNINFEELALKKGTTSYYASADNIKIHCASMADMDQCIDGYERNGGKHPVAIWLGNSQIHAINQMKSGDSSAPLILHNYFQDYERYFLTFSQPNANLQEHLLLFTYLINNMPVDTLILPVVFDDMRESQIRESLREVVDYHNVRSVLNNSTIGKKILLRINRQAIVEDEVFGSKESLQELVEEKINKYFSNISDVWSNRAELRSQTLVLLYKLRNYVFDINPSTTRKIIKVRYDDNIQAIKEILNLAQSHNINVLLYIAPLRNDVRIPYDIKQYKLFKKSIQRFGKLKNVYFFDYEKVVPTKHWGSKDATSIDRDLELDFMHFGSSGHRALAEKIYLDLVEIWSEDIK